jgi:hypothetical protein
VSDDLKIVYVLVNPAMPGMVKIGMTSNSDIEERMRQLYTTGVPVPFACRYACKVKDAQEVERSIHFAFGDLRVNPNREFFKINPERVVAILKLVQVEEVTAELVKGIDAETTPEDRSSAARLRRPNMNFVELGIPLGSILKFKEGTAEAKVISAKKVEFNGEEISLTAATRKVLGLEEGYPLQPSPYWSFNDRTIDDIYEEFHSEQENDAA